MGAFQTRFLELVDGAVGPLGGVREHRVSRGAQ